MSEGWPVRLAVRHAGDGGGHECDAQSHWFKLSRNQNWYFSANCMMRAVVEVPGAVLWICGFSRPKLLLLRAAVGGPNITLLGRLNASARNVNLLRSRSTNVRDSARSMFITF